MPKPRLIISTCGTSVLTNNVSKDLRDILFKYANCPRAEDVPGEPRRQIQQHIEERRKLCAQEDNFDQLMTLSAELNGVIRYYDGHLTAACDNHVLLATDTWLGKEAAQIIEDALKRYGHRAEIKQTPGLRTDNLENFRCAMSELVAWCAQMVRDYRRAGYRVVFNLTGGFKSVQGFMQALGMLYADESVYVFETTKQLLRLPRLPVQLDAEAILREYLPVLRRLAIGLKVNAADVGLAPETLLDIIDDQAVLSTWGELVWQEAYRQIYGKELLPPISPKLKFGPAFPRSLEGQASDRIRHINERLDQLARRLEEGETYNLRSLDFKPLKTIHQNSTHECDAWADGSALRLFGHFEGGTYILDRLGEGLH